MYVRGDVVKGPDLLADHDHRPYVCLSDGTHPFNEEEALYAAATTTRRSDAVPISENDFATGGLPRMTYVNPWTIVTIRHADMEYEERGLVRPTIKK